jgi:hypothetical protein
MIVLIIAVTGMVTRTPERWTVAFAAVAGIWAIRLLGERSAHGQVVMFGGSDEDRWVGGTWTWDGTNWTKHHPAHAPSRRARTSMAYDAARGVVVLPAIATGGHHCSQNTRRHGSPAAFSKTFPSSSIPSGKQRLNARAPIATPVTVFPWVDLASRAMSLASVA